MKTFREHLKEEVKIGALSSGGIDIERDAIRDEVNGILAAIAARPCVTPYSSLNKVRKALAYFHIHLPKKVYLEGRHGIEVWEVNQFGDKMGVDDQGNWIHHVPAKYYLFFHYHRIGSMYYLEAKIVDEKELESRISAAERMVSEEMDAAMRQDLAKSKAPKEKAHTALGDCDCSQGDSPSTKDAVKVSMKKQIDEDDSTKAIQKIVAKNKIKDVVKSGKKKSQAWYDKMTKRANQKEEVELDEVSVGLAHRAAHHAFVKSDKMKKDAQKEPDMHSYVQSVHKAEKKSKQGTRFAKYAAKKMEEDKDPCWKGYEMIGMKKKGARKVPNCVPVKEEQIDEKLTKRMSAADVIHDFVHSKDPKFKGKSTKERQKMALGAYYGMHPEKSKKNLDEDVYAMRKMKQKMDTKVRHGLGVGRETQSIMVKRKGDPASKPYRIPKSKYDPSKHQTV